APYLEQGLIYALEVGHGSADEIIEAFVGIYPALKESLMQAIRQIERRGIQQDRLDSLEISFQGAQNDQNKLTKNLQ
ncbi:MAG: hypothetical protein AAF400_03115, partial [Bacteroidota bacterium]